MERVQFIDVSLEYPLYSIEKFSIRHLVKRKISKKSTIVYDNIHNNSIRALSNINFDLHRGDRLCILGHNGSGKSSLLRLVADIYKPSSGNVNVLGQITTLIDPTLGLDLEATGLENIIIKGLLSGKSIQDINNRMDWIIDFSELGEYIRLPLRTYSSGMMMRLAFSVSTAFKPEILIMDEWLSVGDHEFRSKAAEHLRSYSNDAGILLLATNDLELARQVGNKFMKLEMGNCVQFCSELSSPIGIFA